MDDYSRIVASLGIVGGVVGLIKYMLSRGAARLPEVANEMYQVSNTSVVTVFEFDGILDHNVLIRRAKACGAVVTRSRKMDTLRVPKSGVEIDHVVGTTSTILVRRPHEVGDSDHIHYYYIAPLFDDTPTLRQLMKTRLHTQEQRRQTFKPLTLWEQVSSISIALWGLWTASRAQYAPHNSVRVSDLPLSKWKAVSKERGVSMHYLLLEALRCVESRRPIGSIQSTRKGFGDNDPPNAHLGTALPPPPYPLDRAIRISKTMGGLKHIVNGIASVSIWCAARVAFVAVSYTYPCFVSNVHVPWSEPTIGSVKALRSCTHVSYGNIPTVHMTSLAGRVVVVVCGRSPSIRSQAPQLERALGRIVGN